MFLTACTELTGPEEDSGKTIAPGTGQVLIRLDQLNTRTVIPDPKSLKGLYFTLVFTADGKTSVKQTLKSGLTLTVALESGTWTLNVEGYNGYINEDNIGRLMVEGTSSVPVTAGISSNVDVALVPVFSSDPGVTGTLSYSIGFPPTVSQAFLGLYPLDAPGTGQEIAISANVEGNKVLPAGSYQAFIDLYDSTENKAAIWTGVVHIYDGSDTELAKTFTTDHFAGPQVLGKDKTTLAEKLDEALLSSRGSCTVVLDGNETETLGPQDLKVTGSKTIIIEGNGKTVKLNGNGSLFTLKPGLTLILQNITLEGNGGNNAPVVQVNGGGTLELKAGSHITGNTTSKNGGGVYVAKDGKFTLSGGEISYNTTTISSASSDVGGGGVFIDNGGEFTMSSGKISHNANIGATLVRAGGVYINGGTFTMSGGEISSNTASGNGVHGGGVIITQNGKFTMSGGTISGNTASGSSADSNGGGVCVAGGTFTMSNGAIMGNINTKGSGGGVYVASGTFTMSGGEVSGNFAAVYGGGVYIGTSSYGTFSMNGGVIYGEEEGDKTNTAKAGGAAIYKAGGTVIPAELLTAGMRDTTTP
ncbi:MAG: autotransporter adhesin family protein [Treponema sp.]|jgi:hypothetical protein|nr:autotransporter adhesin family protein [Treponema sp.]